MTIPEFKAWLDGYSASFAGGSPNPDQWAQINAKLATVNAVPLSKYAPAPTCIPKWPSDATPGRDYWAIPHTWTASSAA